MNASDVHKLVPSLPLKGCFNETTNATANGLKNSGRCVQLEGNLLRSKNSKKDLSNGNGCTGEKELCNKITTVASQEDSSTRKYGWAPKSKAALKKLAKIGCAIGDVTCTLLEKVRWYLKQHFDEHKSGETALSTSTKNKDNKNLPTVRPRNTQVYI